MTLTTGSNAFFLTSSTDEPEVAMDDTVAAAILSDCAIAPSTHGERTKGRGGNERQHE